MENEIFVKGVDLILKQNDPQDCIMYLESIIQKTLDYNFQSGEITLNTSDEILLIIKIRDIFIGITSSFEIRKADTN